MKDKALKLALEALENSVDLVREDAYNAEKLYGNYPSRQGKVGGLKVLADDHEKAITAIKEALAQPEQERTDYAVHLNHCNIGECQGVCKYLDDDCPALKHADMKAKWDSPATQQPAQEPVACIHKGHLYMSHEFMSGIPDGATLLYTTPPAAAQPVQETLAYCNPSDPFNSSAFSWPGTARNPCHTTPLTTPPLPQRPWVGLTGNEWFEWWRVSAIADSTEAEIDFSDFFIIAQAVIDKLKETNK